MGRLVMFVVMVGAGVLLLWMAQAAASGRLGRNPVAGIRLPVTMAVASILIGAAALPAFVLYGAAVGSRAARALAGGD